MGVGQPICQDGVTAFSEPPAKGGRFLVLCASAFSVGAQQFPVTDELRNRDRTVNTPDTVPMPPANLIDTWGSTLAMILLHEMSHLLFDCRFSSALAPLFVYPILTVFIKTAQDYAIGAEGTLALARNVQGTQARPGTGNFQVLVENADQLKMFVISKLFLKLKPHKQSRWCRLIVISGMDERQWLDTPSMVATLESLDSGNRSEAEQMGWTMDYIRRRSQLKMRRVM